MPTTYTTRYRPSIHGFHFDNAFRNEIAGPIATWGRCNGMSQTSLDYFYAGRSAPAIRIVDHGVRAVSGLGAASWSANEIELFVRRDGDRVASKTLNGAAPEPWTTLFTGGMSGSPAAASWGPGRVDLVARASDGTYLHQNREGTRWNGVRPCSPMPGYTDRLGGPFDSSPAAAAPFASRLEIYAIHEGKLLFRYYDGGGWHPWAPLGNPPGILLRGDPAAASQYGWMAGVARGIDDGYWLREWAGGGWQPWRPIGDGGGRFTSSPACVSPFPGRFEVYGRGLDGAIWINILQGTWNGWASLGAPPPGLTIDRPAAVGHYGHLSVYALGNDQQTWRRSWGGTEWLPWDTVESAITTESRALVDAIYQRLMESTIYPILSDIATLGVALPFQGAVRNFITLRGYGNDQLFQWANNDELTKLARFLGAGHPIPIGLLDSSGGTGHEVVAFGMELGADQPIPHRALSGPYNFIHVYDPTYPDCDNNTIRLDPRTQTIQSSTGESWRALFVRDDYHTQRPPV